jgi:hypothetical protein
LRKRNSLKWQQRKRKQQRRKELSGSPDSNLLESWILGFNELKSGFSHLTKIPPSAEFLFGVFYKKKGQKLW